MSVKRRFAVAALSLCLLLTLFSTFAPPACAAYNPYPPMQDITNPPTIPCTYRAWELAYERMGVALPKWSNAITWFAGAQRDGLHTGYEPKPNSIVVYCDNWIKVNGTWEDYGHVAYVTEVSGSVMYVAEGGRIDRPATNGLEDHAISDTVPGQGRGHNFKETVLGYIYLDVCEHDPSYSSASNGVCRKCYAWNPAFVTTVENCDTWLTLKGSEAKSIRPGPFNDCGEVRKLVSGQKVHAVAVVRNGRNSGNWYKLDCDDSGNALDAYIYADNVKKTTAPPYQIRFYGLGKDHKNAQFSVGETNAMLTGMLSVTGSASNADVSRVGVILADAAGIQLAEKSEPISTSYDPIYMWFDVNSELGCILRPGTTYYYLCYAVIRGNTFYSEACRFTTAGISADVNVSFYGFGQSHKYAAYSVGETNATLTGLLSVTGGASNSSVTETGIIFSDASGQQLASRSEPISTSYDPIYLWYDVASELGLTLSPGTNYYYQYYAVVNGTRYSSEQQLFTTAGTSPDPTPVQVNFHSAGQSHKYAVYSVGETDATLTALLSVSGSATNEDVTALGMELYDSQDMLLDSASWPESSGCDPIYVWINLNDELHYTLVPGAAYRYRFFAVVGGVAYYSDYYSFTAADSTPAASVSFHDVALSHKYAAYAVGANDATLTALLSVTGSATNADVTEIGMELCDAENNVLASNSDGSNTAYDPIYVWFGVNEELDYTLVPDTVYRYRFFAVVGGVAYYSDYYSFTAAAGGSSASVSFHDIGQDHKYGEYYVGETDANLTALLSVSGGAISQIGVELYDASSILLDSTVWDETSAYDPIYVYVAVNDELNRTLIPGTTYHYKFFAVVDGVRYFSDVQTFVTAGDLPAPGPCSLESDKNEYARRETVTLSFESVGASYYTVEIYREGLLLESLNTDEGAYSLTCPGPGDYCSSVIAVNASGQTASDWVGWIVLPETYTVSYDANGGAAAPEAQTKTEEADLTLSSAVPTREGYAFLGWAESSGAEEAQYLPGGSFTADADTVLYAVWRQQTALSITRQPRNFAGALGSRATFTVEAEGDGLSYQWYVKNRTATKFSKSSITAATYTVTLTEANSGRQLYCVVKDAFGNTAQTDTVTMTVATPLSILTQPANYSGAAGSRASFTVAAAGDGLSYQWYVKNRTATKFSKSSITAATYSVTLTEANSGR
ncbi:MAG: InlB B-repeat-containing protein, partial [Oscillospiraceae bacterium]|nr:InlB B-repeat-containing protein [Oscillospiraceae bacterium]